MCVCVYIHLSLSRRKSVCLPRRFSSAFLRLHPHAHVSPLLLLRRRGRLLRLTAVLDRLYHVPPLPRHPQLILPMSITKSIAPFTKGKKIHRDPCPSIHHHALPQPSPPPWPTLPAPPSSPVTTCSPTPLATKLADNSHVRRVQHLNATPAVPCRRLLPQPRHQPSCTSAAPKLRRPRRTSTARATPPVQPHNAAPAMLLPPPLLPIPLLDLARSSTPCSSMRQAESRVWIHARTC